MTESNPYATATRQPRIIMRCPHCHGVLRVRDSRAATDICRQGQMVCSNTDCGWRGQFTLTLDHTIQQACEPNPDINLPLGPAARRRLEAALAADNARRVSAGPSK